MVMKTSNRWPGLLLAVVAMVPCASAYHAGTYSYTTGCIEEHIADGYCDDHNVRAREGWRYVNRP